VYDLVSSGESSKTWKGRATVLFSDIRDFTAISETMPPEAVVRMLNEYFGLMVEIVFKYKGTLDKFIGDAMLVVFGAPVRIDNSEDTAVSAALEMLSALENLNGRKTARGEEPIRIGIGIHTGEIIAGNIGSTQRTDFTVIGDTVNMASRLESATKLFDERIVISEDTYKKLTDKSLIKGKSLLRVKGKKDDQVIYRI
jgi:adenylate cyclase